MSTSRQVRRASKPPPSKPLFFFRQEEKSGIAPTKRIFNRDVELKEGIKVTVNWEGEKVQGEIVALDGKSCTISKTRASVSSGYPNTEKQMKARGRRPSAFIV